MELSAIENTGRRWVQCKYKMRHLNPGTRPEGSNSPERSNSPEGSNSSDSVEAILGHIQHESASTDVHKCLVSFLKHSGSGHYIMTRTPIRIGQTSPQELRKSACAVPLHGGFYDLLFHNCQVFLIQLLCSKPYNIYAEKLPTTVGSVAAAPTLLILEVCFVALYMTLRHQDLPEVAGALGVLWIATEFFLTYRYKKGEAFCTLGIVATLCLFLFIVLPWPIDLLSGAILITALCFRVVRCEDDGQRTRLYVRIIIARNRPSPICDSSCSSRFQLGLGLMYGAGSFG